MNNRVIYLLLICAVMGFVLTGCAATGCCNSDTPNFNFEVQFSPTTFSAPGQIINVTYLVKDASTAMSVTITDDRTGAVCGPITLSPDSSQTCEHEYVVTAADMGAGGIVITATASGSASGYQDPTLKTVTVQAGLPPIDTGFPWWIPTSGCDSSSGQFYFVVETGYEWLVPEVNVTYTATDGTNSYSCVTEAPSGETYSTGRIRCAGLPTGAPGALEICLQRLGDPSPTCQTLAEFPDSLNGISCAPLGTPNWPLGPPACANELEIYFVIDTGYAWLTPDTDVTYTATDGAVNYTCVTSSSYPGRVACYGYKSAGVGILQFCLQRPLDPMPTCQTYPAFPAAVNGLVCFVPTLPPPPSPCYAITDHTTCIGTVGCKWDDPTNRCVPNP
ncbi:MAG: hypothetical protein FD146_161 [Anaerolineaceae bacterium]|nr:MAG: hypothetical protein FD146_161 [Anaerolineaceae bacterium]